MSPQRARTIDDMILAGLAEGARKLYVEAWGRPVSAGGGSSGARSCHSASVRSLG
jgi:hypothetical protein